MAIRMMGMAREGLLASGRELAAAGIINQPDDLFFLTIDELHSLAAGEARDWPAVVAAHPARYARETTRKLIPRLLMSDGTAFAEGVGKVTAAAGMVNWLAARYHRLLKGLSTWYSTLILNN
ncbi:hypothetical protein [Candidatus Amarobacter glycogenicus]|uniref:hypothetical protein n=1 Tax=Candidatus Amarobacter glycogenicus TaxID=3140699 RepID=UPI002A122543|nr:hypothetical protein [Dehalococcoidia bacterium]